MRHRCEFLWLLAQSGFVVACLLSGLAHADELYLKNGMVLRGVVLKTPGLNIQTAHQNNQGPVPNVSFWMVDDGVRRYFIFRRHIAQHVPGDELASVITFNLKHDKSARTTGPSVVGAFGSVQPFDQYGRRTVTLGTKRGIKPIIQGITALRPDYAKVEGLTHIWEYAIDTKTLPPDVVAALIEQSSNREEFSERKAAVQFYLAAEMFPQAKDELLQIASKFPEQAAWCEDVQTQLAELQARRGLYEIERRRDAGQYGLAYQIAKQAPPDRISVDVLREFQEIVEDAELLLMDRDRAVMLLDMLQAELPEEQALRLRSLRTTVINELHYDTLPRLQPFLRSADDDSLQPSQRLALAYSGWLLGSEHAILDLNEAIRLWDARFLALEYLRTDRDPGQDADILAKLQDTEGISIERLGLMIPNLPLPFEPPALQPGVATTIEVPVAPDQVPIRYSVTIPPEYSPYHRYPLLVVLRGEGRSFDDELHWWAGDENRPGWAQRRGYIVIAPHYCEEEASQYNAGTTEHEIVLKSIAHVRQRLRVDSDRIFLAGHGMGGDACFDMAMSHPGIFAGAIPITGICEKFSRFYWENAPFQSWYVVSGERDRNSMDQNAATLNNMMKNGHDVLYCDYKGRGFESYAEEQERIFIWMQGLRRVPLRDVAKWEAGGLRKSEDTFYWMTAGGLPDRLFPAIAWDVPQRKVLRAYSGNMKAVESINTINVQHPGTITTLWISPEIFDFNNRCRVNVNSKDVYNDFVRPSLEAMLSDVRQRGDRERLYWARLDLN